jgi:hypothetical protein
MKMTLFLRGMQVHRYVKPHTNPDKSFVGGQYKKPLGDWEGILSSPGEA